MLSLPWAILHFWGYAKYCILGFSVSREGMTLQGFLPKNRYKWRSEIKTNAYSRFNADVRLALSLLTSPIYLVTWTLIFQVLLFFAACLARPLLSTLALVRNCVIAPALSSILDVAWVVNKSFLVSRLLPFPYSLSWGSSKSCNLVISSQWTQNSSLYSLILEYWPKLRLTSYSLIYTSLFTMTSLWSRLRMHYVYIWMKL